MLGGGRRVQARDAICVRFVDARRTKSLRVRFADARRTKSLRVQQADTKYEAHHCPAVQGSAEQMR